jgi:hypothetical protein
MFTTGPFASDKPGGAANFARAHTNYESIPNILLRGALVKCLFRKTLWLISPRGSLVDDQGLFSC